MKLFNWFSFLTNWFSKRKENCQEQITSGNQFETQEVIIGRILRELRKIRGTNDLEEITIWTNDATYYNCISNREFMEQFRLIIENNFHLSPKISIKQGPPPTDILKTEIDNNKLFVTINQKNPILHSVQAQLTILDGAKYVENNIYYLDSDKKKVYHIGRGVGTSLHSNDIIIKDNNKVSRSQAEIISGDDNFNIRKVPNSSEIIVIRNEKAEVLKFEAELNDNDIIVLGNSIKLKYRLL